MLRFSLPLGKIRDLRRTSPPSTILSARQMKDAFLSFFDENDAFLTEGPLFPPARNDRPEADSALLLLKIDRTSSSSPP